MGIITALRAGKGRQKRVNLFLDGRFAFSLQTELAAKEGLQIGQEISDSRFEALSRSDRAQRCRNAALRYLSYRPRSQAELRGKLQQRDFDMDNIEAVLIKLKEQGLIDDSAFAQFWKDNRKSFSPRSQWLTRLELRRKGVAEEIIDQAVGALDDGESAYQAALGRAQRLPLADYQVFRRRLSEYLRRRGFNYEVINHTVQRTWQECGSRPG